jgi:hypothetical protein
MEAPIDRLLSLVRRELGAEDVRVLDLGAEPPAASNVVHAAMPDGRTVVVSYGAVPADRDARLRRLEMLIRTFGQSLVQDEQEQPASRRPPQVTLTEELRALTQRAQAINALVIDTESPIEWGSALPADGRSGGSARPGDGGGTVAMLDWSRRQLMDGIRTDLDEEDANDASVGDVAAAASGVGGVSLADSSDMPAAAVASVAAAPVVEAAAPALSELTEVERWHALSEQAKTAARALPGTSAMAKGGHLHHAARGGPWFVARSFAGIYLLVLVFEGEYDELRAERAILEGLARVERMVMALPPLDPEPAPTADVIRLRRRR